MTKEEANNKWHSTMFLLNQAPVDVEIKRLESLGDKGQLIRFLTDTINDYRLTVSMHSHGNPGDACSYCLCVQGVIGRLEKKKG